MFKKISVFLGLAALAALISNMFTQTVVHIAFIGSLTGSDNMVAKQTLEGAKIAVEQINANKGEGSRKIMLDIYDDKGQYDLAQEFERRSRNSEKIIGIINANKDYKYEENHPDHLKTPMILTNSSAEVSNNKDNIFNLNDEESRQLKYMALYGKYIFNSGDILVVGSAESANYVRKVLPNDVGVHHVNHVDDLKLRAGQVVLLADNLENNIKSIKKIRSSGANNVIISNSELTKVHEMKDSFDYENVFAVTPSLIDLAGEHGLHFRKVFKNKFKTEPTPDAIKGYDSLKLLTKECLKESCATNHMNSILSKQDRDSKISDSIKKVGAISKNITEHDNQYIADNMSLSSGQNEADLYLGRIDKNKIVPAYTQLTKAKDLDRAKQIKASKPQKSRVSSDYFDFSDFVFAANGEYFYKTNLIFSGVNVQKVYDIKDDANTARIKYEIWFRCGKNFLNSLLVDNAKHKYVWETEKAFKDIMTPNLLNFSGTRLFDNKYMMKDGDKDYLTLKNKYSVSSETIYNTWEGDSSFYMNSFHNQKPNFYKKSHNLGIQFAPNFAGDVFVRYIRDYDGADQIEQNLQESKAFNDSLGSNKWKLDDYNIYSDKIGLSAQGYKLYQNDNEVSVSRFNANISVLEDKFSIFDHLNYELLKNILIISMSIMFVSGLIRRYYDNRALKLFDFVPATLTVIASQSVLMNFVLDTAEISSYGSQINLMFEIFWWFVVAKLVSLMVDIGLWSKIEKYTQRKVPRLLYTCLDLLIYTMAIFGVVAFVLDRPITSLLASAGFLTFIIGLAIQMNVSNIFSGIFMHVEGALKEGDWVEADSYAGWIQESGWRTTSLLTEAGTVISIPNSKLAESTIKNYNMHDSEHMVKLPVKVDIMYNPNIVVAVLKNAIKIHKCIKSLKIGVSTFEDDAVVYNILIGVEKYSNPTVNKIHDYVYKIVWDAFDAAGISAVTKDSTDVLLKYAPDDNVDVKNVLQNHPVISKFSKTSMTEIIKNAELVDVSSINDIDKKYVYINCSGDLLLKHMKTEYNGVQTVSYVKLPEQFLIGIEEIFHEFSYSYKVLSDSKMIKVHADLIKKSITDKVHKFILESYK